MASQHWVQRIQKVESYVRAHLARPLDVNHLATVAASSPYHFHRIFRAVTGETVAAFVRRARLERAAYLMKARPEKALTSIALETGFPSHSDFTRSFSRAYGIAPSRWDRQTHLGHIPADKTLPQSNHCTFPVSVVTHQPCRLAYVRTRACFQIEALQDGYHKLTTGLAAQGIDWKRTAMVGMSWDHYKTTNLDQVSYDLGFVVPHDFQPNGDINTYDLQGYDGVHVHCCGAMQIIADAWDFLYDQWLPDSRYEPDDLPAMKHFNKRPDEVGWVTWDVDCVIALRASMP